MVWIALATLLALAVALGIAWKNSGRSDAAGNGLEHAYLVFCALGLLVIALPVVIGWWLDSWWLMSTPLLIVAAPVVIRMWKKLRTMVRRSVVRLRSRLPTAALRNLEWALSAGWIREVEDRLTETSVSDPTVGRELVRAALNGCDPKLVLPPLLAAGADGSDPEAIVLAAERAPNVLPLLLKNGADPATRLPSGDPLPFIALDIRDFSLLEKLIQAGSSPNVVDREGWPLLLALASGRRNLAPGNWYCVARLIELGADPTVISPDGRSLGVWFRETNRQTIHPKYLAFLTAKTDER